MHTKLKRKDMAGYHAIFALVFVLSGCSTGGTDNDAKLAALSIFIDSPHQQPAADNKIYRMMEESTGVRINMEFLVGDLEQKLAVMIAGGNYPDMMTGNDSLIAAGAFIPLEELIEQYAPNLKRHYAQVWNQMKDPETGHIYVLPNFNVFSGEYNETTYQGPAFYLQKDVLKEMGYPTPRTLDEYFEIIAEYKAKHPEMIGFESLNFDWRTFPLQNPPEHLSGHPNDGNVIVDNGVAQIFADKDIAKTYYKKLNEMNVLGLLDKEAFLQSYEQYLAKIASGRVIGMFDQYWNFSVAEDSLISQGKIGSTYVGFPLLYPGAEEYYRDRPAVNINRGYGISVTAEDPVSIIRFFDLLITEDWQKILQWGIQGEDYEVGEDGTFYRTAQQRANADDSIWKLANKAEAFFYNLPKIQGSYSDGNAADPGSQPQEFFDSLKPQDQEVLTAYGHKTWAEFFRTPEDNPVYYPAWSITLADGSPAQLAGMKLNALSIEYLPKAIMAGPEDFEKIWLEYIQEISKLDIEAYEKSINEQIQWRIHHWTSK